MKGDFLPKFANGMTLVTLSAARKGSLEALLNTPNAPTLLIILRYYDYQMYCDVVESRIGEAHMSTL